MNVNSRLVLTSISVGLLMLMTSCGGGGGTSQTTPSDTDPDPGPDPIIVEPGEIPSLSPRARVFTQAPDIIIDAMLNPTGSEVAILSGPPHYPGSPQVFTVSVYDSNTGALVRTMSDSPVDIPDVLGIYWGADRISVLKFGGGVISWDAATGAILNNNGPAFNGDCNFISPVEAFDATANRLYAGESFSTPFVCDHDFNAFTTRRRSVELPSPSVGIESMALGADGASLWISHRDSSLRVTGTQIYDVSTFNPIGEFQSNHLGAIVGVGNGFQLFDTNDIVLQPVGTVLDGGSSDVTTSTQSRVMGQRFSDMTRLVAVPELTYIGEIEKDIKRKRSFSTEGTVGAFVIDNVLEVYTLDLRGSVSAIEPPTRFASTLSGTVVIDGVTQTLTGTCYTRIEPDLGADIIDIEATTFDGSRLFVHAQNLLGFVSYRLAEGVPFTDSAVNYVHSTTLSQNFELERPMISTDGTSITGSTLLYRFSGFFLELELDADDPTGFATRSLTLDATCI